jgi:hypothetical protein
MLNRTFTLLLIAITLASNAIGQNLITNGSFESTPSFSNWTVSTGGLELWYGTGVCGASAGTKYSWSGGQTDNVGLDDLLEEVYQTVTIPSNASVCSLYFDARISTLDGTNTVYDSLIVGFKTQSGALLTSWWLSNMNATSTTIPGCGNWVGYSVLVPSSLYGQTLRFFMRHHTDFTNPTIFRVDDVELLAVVPSCTYSISPSTYNFSNSAASNGIATVSTQPGCAWNATVTSGSSWLSCTSSGSGSGVVFASVISNTSSSSRTGIINVNGQQLVVVQQGVSCAYSLSSNSYSFSSSSAASNLVSNVVAPTGCNWSANVTSGSSWLSSISSGSGNGQIIVAVTVNNNTSSRTGTIDIAGQTLTIVQPGISCTYALSSSSFTCSSNNNNNYSASSVIAPTGCSWTAIVSSGGSWLSSTSSGVGNGNVNIQVSSNLTNSPRVGIIEVNGQNLTVIQPGISVGYSELGILNLFEAYPNPTDGVISVNFETQQDEIIKFEIFDAFGRLVRQESFISQGGFPYKTKVDLKPFEKGMYMFRISNSHSDSISKRILLR